MNTPEPCDVCKNLYFDAMNKNNPSYVAECKKGLEMGNKKCESFEHYRSQENTYMSFGDILRKYIDQ